MDLANGLLYNIRGLWFGVKNIKLLFWGLLRFALVILITILLAGLILAYHQAMMDFIWTRPESRWVLWLWHLLSWLLTLFLVGVATLFSYLISQILFSVLIMDHMSRITEREVTGHVREPPGVSLWRRFLQLVKQEIPRSIVPLLIAFLIVIPGWFIALGPILLVISSAIAIIFLSWDNTDLIPARRMVPFMDRFRSLLKTLLFHLGFGLPFLLPVLNILFLSFAPVGATLYYLEKQELQRKVPPDGLETQPN